MALWIDPPAWPAHGRLWSHLISDTSLEELHAFADRVGIPGRSFEGDHYDIPAERHAQVLDAGARLTTGTDLVRRLMASGLRFRKRKGERPLARHVDGLPAVGGPHVLDVIASTLEPPVTSGAAVVLVRDAVGRLLLVRNESRPGWAPPGGKRDAEESVRAAAVRELAEETSLQLDPADLTPVGYERIEIEAGDEVAPWGAGANHIAVFSARLMGTPSVAPREPDVLQARWVDLDTARQACGDQPWWVLVEHHVGG